MPAPAATTTLLLLLAGATAPTQADAFREFSSKGLAASRGVVVRLTYPATWRPVASDDPLALTELRGSHAGLEGIVQVGRARLRRGEGEAACRPERAQVIGAAAVARNPDTRILEVTARAHQGQAGFTLRYERSNAPGFMLVRSTIVCHQDSMVMVSCAGTGAAKAKLAEIEPVCSRVLESLSVADE